MDLNKIELPASVIADLYPSSLVENDTKMTNKRQEPLVEPTIPDPGSTNLPAWKFLGNNQKNVLVVVENSGSVHLPDEELSFLTGILGACQLSLADVAIVNLHQHRGVSYRELTHYFKSRIVLLFAIEPASFGLPMHFPQYQVQPFNGTSFLYAPSLKDLENDRVEKSKLWVCLKRLFNL